MVRQSKSIEPIPALSPLKIFWLQSPFPKVMGRDQEKTDHLTKQDTR